MNTIGNLGGATAGFATGYILKHYLASYALANNTTVQALTDAQKAEGMLPAYQICFITFGVVYVVATLCWLFIDSTKPIAPDEERK